MLQVGAYGAFVGFYLQVMGWYDDAIKFLVSHRALTVAGLLIHFALFIIRKMGENAAVERLEFRRRHGFEDEQND